MKTPTINQGNVLRIYKSAWFITQDEVAELKKSYVYQNKPIGNGDMFQDLYVGIAYEDFEKFQKGAKTYRAILVCKDLIDMMKRK